MNKLRECNYNKHSHIHEYFVQYIYIKYKMRRKRGVAMGPWPCDSQVSKETNSLSLFIIPPLSPNLHLPFSSTISQEVVEEEELAISISPNFLAPPGNLDNGHSSLPHRQWHGGVRSLRPSSLPHRRYPRRHSSPLLGQEPFPFSPLCSP